MKQYTTIIKVLNYYILLRKEPKGGYTIIVPSLPGCVTYGDAIEEAKEMAKEAIELYIENLKENSTSMEPQHKALEWR